MILFAKAYARVVESSNHRHKMNKLMKNFALRFVGCATNPWCEVLIKGASDETNGIVKP